MIIYRLICKGTIEEKIYERQIFKILLSSRILQNARQKALINRGSLQELFELGDQDEDHDLPQDGDLLSKGGGYHAPEESAFSKDYRLLQALFEGKSVAGVYDHNFLEAQIVSSITNNAEAQAAKVIVEKAKSRLVTSFAGESCRESEERSSIQYSILQRLEAIFVGRRALASQEVLLNFGDISAENAPIFREMLRKVARFRNGMWHPLRFS